MMSTLMKRDIPTFVPEVGPDTKGGLKTGIRGFENSLRYLGMLPGKAQKLKKYQSFPDVIHIFPSRGGVFTSYVALDDEVKAGQKIASIRGFRGDITEELVSPKVAETLAREVGVTTAVFNPLEGLTRHELSVGQDYVSVMRANLTTLEKALGCPAG